MQNLQVTQNGFVLFTSEIVMCRLFSLYVKISIDWYLLFNLLVFRFNQFFILLLQKDTYTHTWNLGKEKQKSFVWLPKVEDILLWYGSFVLPFHFDIFHGKEYKMSYISDLFHTLNVNLTVVSTT